MTISGVVIEGAKRGKKLGFPTANILFTQNIEDGIYISKTTVDQETFNSITFIGAAITYEELDRKAESYIFNFDSNIYGRIITIELLKKIRNNEKFESEQKLIVQMNEDIKKAIQYFTITSESS